MIGESDNHSKEKTAIKNICYHGDFNNEVGSHLVKVLCVMSRWKSVCGVCGDGGWTGSSANKIWIPFLTERQYALVAHTHRHTYRHTNTNTHAHVHTHLGYF